MRKSYQPKLHFLVKIFCSGKIPKKILLTLAVPIFPIFSINAQTHDITFRTKNLIHGEGTSISNVKVDINNGEYIGFTDANGEVVIHDVRDGTHSITFSKSGYKTMSRKSYSLNSDVVFNAALPQDIRVGPWGTDNFSVFKYKSMFFNMLGTDMDPFKWAQIAPINVKITSAIGQLSSSDSLLAVQSLNIVENGTGYDLTTVVSSTISPYHTIELNSTSFSSLDIDYGIIIGGISQVSTTTLTKRIIHELTAIFHMRTLGSPAPFLSAMDPAVQTMTDPQVWDLDNIALTFDQHYARQANRQDCFLSNMDEYVAPVVPVDPANSLPVNGATNLETTIRTVWSKSTGADRYHVDIARDANFTNIVKDLLVQRVDTTLTGFDPATTYYMRVRAENGAGNSLWSAPTSFTTKSVIVLPGTTTVNSPRNDHVLVPVQFDYSTPNATSWHIQLANNSGFSPLVKDTVVNNNHPVISLTTGTHFNARIHGINSGGDGPLTNWDFITIKGVPGDFVARSPVGPDVSLDAVFSWDLAPNAESYNVQIFKEGELLTDTIVTGNSFIKQLAGHRNYSWSGKSMNSDLESGWSSPTNFSTINRSPVLNLLDPNGSSLVDPNKDVSFNWTSSDPDSDPLTHKLRIYATGQDTTIVDVASPYVLPKGFLKPKKVYSYDVISSDNDKSITKTGSFNTIDTGIDDVKAELSLQIYPNPSLNYLTVSFKGNDFKEIYVFVYSINGKLQKAQLIKNKVEKLDISFLKPGTYYLKIGRNENKVKKIAVQFVKQ